MILEFGGQEGTNSQTHQLWKTHGRTNACFSFYPVVTQPGGGTGGRKLALLRRSLTCFAVFTGSRALLPVTSLWGKLFFSLYSRAPCGNTRRGK